MSQVIEPTAFPSVMRDKLRIVRWRQAGVFAGRAVVLALTVLIAAMVLSMVADWCFTIFDTSVRKLLTAASLLLTAATLLYFGWRPVVEALGWTRAATSVDDVIPQLQERWTTVANFTRSARQPATPTAQAMLQQVTSEAVAMGRLVKPKQIVNLETLRQPAMMLACAIAVLTVFMLLNPAQTWVLLQRFWSPDADITATQLESVTQGAVVPRGETVEVVTRLSGLARDTATLTIISESLPPETLELTPDPEQPELFVCTVNVDDSFSYRVQAGDGRTQWHDVTAIDYPLFSEVRLTVTPPEYVDDPVVEKTLIPGRLRAIQGSFMELSMKPDTKLERLDLLLTLPPEPGAAESGPGVGEDKTEGASKTAQPRRQTLTLHPGTDGWYHFETQLVENFTLSPVLLNRHGLENENQRVCRIQVIGDKAPVARIISPREEMAVNPDEVIDIKFEAHDDHGIATAELVIYDESEREEGEEPAILEVREIPLGDQQLQKHVMGRTQLDLRELGLKEDQEISYSVRVTDNRTLNLDANDVRSRMEATAEARPETGEVEESGEQNDDEESPSDRQNDSGAQSGVTVEKETKQNETNGKSNGQSDTENDPTSNDPARNDRQHDAGGGYQEMMDKDREREPEQDKPTLSANTESVSEQSKSDHEQSDGDGESPSDNDAQAANRRQSDAGNSDARQTDADNDGKQTSEEMTQKDDEESGPPDSDRKMPEDETGDSAGSESQPQNPTANTKDPQSPNAEKSRIGEQARTGDNDSPQNARSDDNNSTANSSDSDKQKTDRSTSAPPNSDRSDRRTNENDQKAIVVQGDKDGRPGAPDDRKDRKDRDMAPMDKDSQDVESPIRLVGQRSDQGQRRETNRKKLKVSKRLAALAERNKEQKTGVSPARDKVVEIRKRLIEIEKQLTALYRHEVENAGRAEQFRELDEELGDVQSIIADLHTETRDSKFEFVGLQMVDIGSTHVTPARDAVFVAIRTPDSASDVHTEEALHHVVSALELLDALLKKYDRVARDVNLAKKLDEAIEIYTVVVEGTQRLMRAAQQNHDPLKLKRQMAVVEVDQAYLDRLAEVRRMRRDMLAELARILSDDPRLRAKYLDLIKRNRSSLRSQLAELFDRQDQIAQEVNGWTQVSENQRENYWLQISDLRMDAPRQLAKNAQAFVDRIEKQMPLVLNATQGTPALVIELARQIGTDVRRCDLDVREIRKSGGELSSVSGFSANANELVFRISELAAALEQMNFEAEDREGVSEYVTLRLAENRALADQADVWAESAGFIERHEFSGLAQVDQQQVAIATEILRLDMLDIEVELTGQFRGEPIPQKIANIARDLLRVMERITFNQAAASFALSRDDAESAGRQQNLALDAFEEAEDLFDRLRKETIVELDKQEVPDPDINDLRDPTLDEFLARLEREPNIEALLGIPARPRNIRQLQDSMMWQQDGGGMLGQSRNAANGRAEEERQRRLRMNQGREKQQKPKSTREMTEEEKSELAAAKDMQEMLASKMKETLKELQKRASDESVSEEQRKQMREMASRMQQSLEQMDNGNFPEDMWDRFVESEQAQQIAARMAAGEPLPDEQWNKLMSTLDDGLWQVGDRTPPEDYRRAIEQYQDRVRELTGIGAD